MGTREVIENVEHMRKKNLRSGLRGARSSRFSLSFGRATSPPATHHCKSQNGITSSVYLVTPEGYLAYWATRGRVGGRESGRDSKIEAGKVRERKINSKH